MRTLIFILFCSFTSLSFSQSEEEVKSARNGGVPLEELPEIVITKIGDDFSVYLPYKNPDLSIQSMQKYFIAYDLGKDFEGYDTYLVMMKNEKGLLTATYNQKGKLIRVVEKYENVTLPDNVIVAVLKAYPGWGIVEDKFHYVQADGDIHKKEYWVKIQKGKKTKRIAVAPNGDILNGN
ncbi:hypothetical protein NHF50_12365 [Flavobacterium sp. NRK F10]|uniref:Nicotinate-nucleotide adenylyltransferase n=1 Tax=Flavobacterium sediminis TaxID=2201181 RepID=A0A2U8QWK5_9FLAO|nr:MULTISPECIES: hypothetical protein [Flavobacterium]AWM14592.1 hypothetical protein DI487_12495 [Flavobacterium sediminis]MCO6175838.1 hypothetical protein [Flavobacterium sp. NRK F10]